MFLYDINSFKPQKYFLTKKLKTILVCVSKLALYAQQKSFNFTRIMICDGGGQAEEEAGAGAGAGAG